MHSGHHDTDRSQPLNPSPSVASRSIEDYIGGSWSFLERSVEDLVEASVDPKLGARERYPVFIAPTQSENEVSERLREVLTADDLRRLELRVLPPSIKEQPQLPGGIDSHGLLYLPHPYVVPGGRFNEMYGWDSYFINLGLLLDGRIEQARQMVDNHMYQVRHYGRVLNANRTYYLTRSQPPFLARMVRDVYEVTKDSAWLKSCLDGLVSTYDFWTSPPHLTPETGLSRYFDLGEGPADEVTASETDEVGRTHYDRILCEFRELAKLENTAAEELLGYPLELYYDRVQDQLTARFFVGDRSMRESGYDPSDRFGRFNIDVTRYNALDLNSLLFAFECDMGDLASLLGNQRDVAVWRERGSRRREAMNRWLWDAEKGLFCDYNVETGLRRDYPFATTFFPLWHGWATPEQAAAVHDNLVLFERPGGVVTSTTRTGNQWDAPFGWAPLQLAAVLGLSKFGFVRSARRLSEAFTSMVESEYEKTGTIVEKYDVVERSADVSSGIEFGYSSNEIGFGWTNGVYLALKRMCADQ